MIAHLLINTDPNAEPPVSACGEWGYSTAIRAEVTCPACLGTQTSLGKFHRGLLDLGWAIVDSLIAFLDKHDPQTTVTRSRWKEGDSQNG